MPFEVGTTATRQALPNLEILAHPLDTSVIENIVLAAAATSVDSSGPYTGRRYLLAGTVLAKRDDGLYIPFVHGGGAFSEVQVVKITGASGGTFKLTFEGQTTTAIAWNATTTVVKEALEALSNIGSSEAAVTGAAGAWTVTFAGTLAEKDLKQMTIDTTATTGTDPEGTVETTKEGAEKIAGLLYETQEFADASSNSNEPAALLNRFCSFKKQAIPSFTELETELTTWGNLANVQCQFVSVTNAQES